MKKGPLTEKKELIVARAGIFKRENLAGFSHAGLQIEGRCVRTGGGDGGLTVDFTRTVSFLKVIARVRSSDAGRPIRLRYRHSPFNDYMDAQSILAGFSDGNRHVYYYKFDPAIRSLAYTPADIPDDIHIDELQFLRLERWNYYSQKTASLVRRLMGFGIANRQRIPEFFAYVKRFGFGHALRKIKETVFRYGLYDDSLSSGPMNPSLLRIDRRYHFVPSSIVAEPEEAPEEAAVMFSIIVLLTQNDSSTELLRTLRSIEKTRHPDYEIIIGTNTFKEEELPALVNAERKEKPVVQYRKNAAAPELLNRILPHIRGDYFIVLRAGDELAESALAALARQTRSGASIIYADHDHISPDGRYDWPAFKPDFDEERLLAHDYFSRAVALSATYIQGLVRCDPASGPAYFYDLILQCLFEASSPPDHIPQVLFHLRNWPPEALSQCDSPDEDTAKEYCNVVKRHFKRQQITVEVKTGDFPHTRHVFGRVDEQPLVSIVIPFRDQPELLDTCLKSILTKTSYPCYEIVGLDNRSQDPRIERLVAEYRERYDHIRFFDYDAPFNYADMNNRAMDRWCRGDYIVLLNNDIEILTDDWIERMLYHARQSDVGIVGAKLYYPDGRIQHAGVGLGINDLAAHLHRAYPGEAPGYLFEPHVTHNASAVTAACLMISKDIYEDVGGMDAEHLKVAFNDVDLCLRVKAKGYKIVYTPLCRAIHHESVSRKAPTSPAAQQQFQSEVAFMQTRYRELLDNGDPFVNRNLSRYLNTPQMDVAILTIRMKSGYGVDVVVDIQARGLCRAGFKVTVYAADCDTELFGDREYDLVPVRLDGMDRLVDGLNASSHTFIIAHTSPFFEILPRIARQKVTVAYEHGDPEPSLFGAHEREVRQSIKDTKRDEVYPTCNAVVAISRFIRQDIGWPNAIVNPNGADHLVLERSTAQETEVSRAMASEKIKILCVSRLGRGEGNYKGYDAFIEFSRDLDPDRFECVLLGAGSRSDKKRIEKQGLKVILNASHAELINSYRSCDLFISFSKWEGFNLPVVEAQFFGKPALALDRCSHREVTPLVFENVDEMARFVNGCSRTDLQEHGRRAREFVNRFTWRQNTDFLEKLLFALVSGYDFFAAVQEPMQPSQSLSAVFWPPRQYDKDIVSICILTKDKLDFIRPCVESIVRHIDSEGIEVLIGDTGSTEQAVLDYYRTLPECARVIDLGHYHFSANNNALSRHARGRFLFFLNNDTEIRSAIFPELLLPFKSKKVGIVGTRLLFPDNTLQHAGAEIFTRDPYRYVGWHPYARFPGDFPEANRIKEMPGVTGAALLIKHDMFDNLGGFDEGYHEECQDMDLCMKTWQAGFKVIYYPHVEMLHFENGTRTIGEDNHDRRFFRERWASFIDATFFARDTQSHDWVVHACLELTKESKNEDIERFLSVIEPLKSQLRLTLKSENGQLPYHAFVLNLIQGVRHRVIANSYEDNTRYDIIEKGL